MLLITTVTGPKGGGDPRFADVDWDNPKLVTATGSAFYLLDKDFDVPVLPGGPFGHGAALIQNPEKGGYTYFSFGPGGADLDKGNNLTVTYFDTLDDARGALTKYDYALEFEVPYSRLGGAVEYGNSFDGKPYFPNSSIFGYNCCEAAGGILQSAGVDWQYSRSPIKSYNLNADNAIKEYAPWRMK